MREKIVPFVTLLSLSTLLCACGVSATPPTPVSHSYSELCAQTLSDAAPLLDVSAMPISENEPINDAAMWKTYAKQEIVGLTVARGDDEIRAHASQALLATIKYYEITGQDDAEVQKSWLTAWQNPVLQEALKNELAKVQSMSADARRAADKNRYASRETDFIKRHAETKFCEKENPKETEVANWFNELISQKLHKGNMTDVKAEVAGVAYENFGDSYAVINDEILSQSVLAYVTDFYKLKESDIRNMMVDEIYVRLMQRNEKSKVLDRFWTIFLAGNEGTRDAQKDTYFYNKKPLQKEDLVLAFARVLVNNLKPITRNPVFISAYVDTWHSGEVNPETGEVEKNKKNTVEFVGFLAQYGVIFPKANLTNEADIMKRADIIAQNARFEKTLRREQQPAVILGALTQAVFPEIYFPEGNGFSNVVPVGMLSTRREFYLDNGLDGSNYQFLGFLFADLGVNGESYSPVLIARKTALDRKGQWKTSTAAFAIFSNFLPPPKSEGTFITENGKNFIVFDGKKYRVAPQFVAGDVDFQGDVTFNLYMK